MRCHRRGSTGQVKTPPAEDRLSIIRKAEMTARAAAEHCGCATRQGLIDTFLIHIVILVFTNLESLYCPLDSPYKHHQTRCPLHSTFFPCTIDFAETRERDSVRHNLGLNLCRVYLKGAGDVLIQRVSPSFQLQHGSEQQRPRQAERVILITMAVYGPTSMSCHPIFGAQIRGRRQRITSFILCPVNQMAPY